MAAPHEKPVRRPPGGASCRGWFGEMSQVDFEIEFFERVLKGHPAYINVLRVLGELYACKGEHAHSESVDRRLVALVPEDCLARYNLACSLARQGSTRQALEELGLALQYGYDDFAHLEIDPDLDGLRHLPGYRALLKEYGLES
jgi:tetratricopeptide (TPR) repeat protein